LARLWLKKNTHNRGLKPALIDRLTKQILLGEWELNGETIKFDTDGVLLDGQNRLHAIASAEVPCPSYVIFDLPHKAQETVDMGNRRSLADILKLRGEKANVALATTLNWIWRLEQGRPRSKFENNPTPGQALALLEKHPEIRDAMRNASRIAGHKAWKLSPPIIAALWFKFSQLDEEDNKNFWEGVATGFYANGSHVGHDSGPYALQRWLQHDQNTLRETAGWIKAALIIKAWNAYRNGSTVKLLAFKAGGARPESFPEPV
jgi:hypothetical protein